MRKSGKNCVNPLHVGELISTRSRGNWVVTQSISGVNPLHVGELISTKSTLVVGKTAVHGVNPLHVGELISTQHCHLMLFR